MRNRIIQLASLAVLGIAALSMPRDVSARAEACAGQEVCTLGCPSNITLFCQVHANCTPGNPPYGVCEPHSLTCIEHLDKVLCGGAQ